MRAKKLIVGAAVTVGASALGLLASGVAGAQDAGLSDVEVLGTQVNLLWVVIGAALVVFMQAGFALVETGFCRAKHATHVVSTNFAIFGLGFVAFFAVGFAFAFGGFSYAAFGMNSAIGEPLVGSGSWVFLWKGGFFLGDIGKAGGAAVAGFFLYMVAFMDTVATIPTGSMAERWKWKSFVVWGLFCGAIYYPLFAAWTWGGGWLSQLGNSMELGFGYVDFAGSGVVHAVGGVAALAGAIVLGPRIGKFNKDGSANTIPGHHIPMAMLGCFILLFGWFGFNAASTFAATDVQFAYAATNTGIAAAFGAVTAMLIMQLEDRQARPRHDGQRHAGGPGGHHRPLRLRGSVGRCGHRHLCCCADHLRCGLHREAWHRRSGGRHRRARCRWHSTACSPWASSPTASTAPAGTSPRRVRRPRPTVSRASSTTPASASSS